MNWRIKYLIQKTLSLLPGDAGFRANRYLSRHHGGLREINFYGIHNTLSMCGAMEPSGFDPGDRVFLEIGTGWTASSALMLLALGARAVHSYDLFPHLDEKLVALARQEMTNVPAHTDRTYPFPCDMMSWAAKCNPSAIDLQRFHYHAPHDARSTGLDSGSVDCVFSQAVFEHIPEPIIVDLLKESHRVLRSGGLCYHYVQPTMHAAQMDSHATGIDYLTCSDWVWRTFFENGISHENRLRGVCYLELLRQGGFEIVNSWHTVDAKALSALPKKKLAPRFRRFSAEEIATDYIWIVGRKP
jgi:SAM-dependent methyltransferase